MISFIKKIFKEKSEKQNLLIKEQENSVSFITTKNNQPVIELSIQHLDDNNAQKFAEILYLIGNNYYQEDILTMLTEMSQKEPNRSDFITKVISYWGYYISERDNKYEPYVSPLSFSKLVRHNEVTNER